jgi:hypothetical protein
MVNVDGIVADCYDFSCTWEGTGRTSAESLTYHLGKARLTWEMLDIHPIIEFTNLRFRLLPV